MHFLIPDTTDNIDSNGGSYTTYNLHINGSLHSSIRYNDFYNFNERLSEDFLTTILPSFPPKKLFPLLNSQIESRRLALERYIQMVSMNNSLKKSNIFNHFIRTAQQKTLSAEVTDEKVEIDIYLTNGQHTTIADDSLTTMSKCADVMKVFYNKVELDKKFRDKFALYLVRRKEHGDLEVVRTLQDFECPVISLKLANKTQEQFCLMIRKAYWDTMFDEDILKDKIATNLLYTQVVSENVHCWTIADVKEKKELKSLRKRGDKKQYIIESRKLEFYANERFLNCTSDYSGVVLNADKPTVHNITVYIGHKDLIILDISNSNVPLKDTVFKITRIRCWRLINTEDRDEIESDEIEDKVQLKFEYLFAPNTLRWVSVYSDQAIYMSMCLQSVVNELIATKGLGAASQPATIATATNKQTKSNRVADWALKAVGGGGGSGGGGGGGTNGGDKVSPCSKRKLDHNFNQNSTSEAFECIGDDDL